MNVLSFHGYNYLPVEIFCNISLFIYQYAVDDVENSIHYICYVLLLNYAKTRQKEKKSMIQVQIYWLNVKTNVQWKICSVCFGQNLNK